MRKCIKHVFTTSDEEKYAQMHQNTFFTTPDGKK
jgi:hypothetical protein